MFFWLMRGVKGRGCRFMNELRLEIVVEKVYYCKNGLKNFREVKNIIIWLEVGVYCMLFLMLVLFYNIILVDNV